MRKVGLTGGIGSGKSTAAKIFRTLGVPVYDSDSRAKELMLGEPIREQIISLFGPEAYQGTQLNRAFIAVRAFTDKTMLDRLNSIVHPAVMDDFEKWAGEMEQCGHRYAIQENAILFDHGFQRGMDHTVTINAPAGERVARASSRDGRDPQDVVRRIENQLTDKQREDMADYVVNNGERELLVPQIVKLHWIFIGNK